MLRYIKEYRFAIILFLFLLIPIIGIDTNTRSARDFRFHDRVILTLTTPVQTVISSIMDGINGFTQNYVFLVFTRKENQRLIDENRALLRNIADLREMEQENLRLRRLLDYKERYKLKTVVARVIAKDVSTEFRMIRINRGQNAGITREMAVVTYEGIVGRVLRVTPTTSDVVTLLDPLSAADAINERSRSPGIVVGKTETSLQLKYTLRTDDIQVNDILVSSGLVGIFPRGLPIGKVTKVAKRPYGISQEVEISPTVQFNKLEEVFVVTEQEGRDTDLIKETPKKGTP